VTVLLATERLEAFYGASQVLHGIALTVRRGEQVALMGRNGMGKTTLLRAIMGLGATRRGQILLDGRDDSSAQRESIAV
jgi:branched-chain amino acid transport system ATP-binding protein